MHNEPSPSAIWHVQIKQHPCTEAVSERMRQSKVHVIDKRVLHMFSMLVESGMQPSPQGGGGVRGILTK